MILQRDFEEHRPSSRPRRPPRCAGPHRLFGTAGRQRAVVRRRRPLPASATPSPSAASGPNGDFATAAEACAKISEQATGATLLPLSAAQGKTAELKQYEAELAATAERVPDSLKADFAKLKDVAVAGVTDQTVFSSGKLQAAMAPVTEWIAANCK